MAISYGLDGEHLTKFLKTCKVSSTNAENLIQLGVLRIQGLRNDCTSIHIDGANNLLYTKPSCVNSYSEPAELALEEIKRYMWYSGKNTAILTFAVSKKTKTSTALCDDVEVRIKELGLSLVAVQQGSRVSCYNKYTALLLVDPPKIGYHHCSYTDFTLDPWWKARPENQPKPVEVEQVKKKVSRKAKEIVL